LALSVISSSFQGLKWHSQIFRPIKGELSQTQHDEALCLRMQDRSLPKGASEENSIDSTFK